MTKRASRGGRTNGKAVLEERLRYTLNEAMQLLQLSHETLRRRINAGAIKVVRDGDRVYIARDELHRYAAEGWTPPS